MQEAHERRAGLPVAGQGPTACTTSSHIAWNPPLLVPGTQTHKAADVEAGAFS